MHKSEAEKIDSILDEHQQIEPSRESWRLNSLRKR